MWGGCGCVCVCVSSILKKHTAKYIQYYSLLNVVSRIPFMARCTWGNIMWWRLSVTCDRSLLFFRVLRFQSPIRVITKLPNTEQSSKRKGKSHRSFLVYNVCTIESMALTTIQMLNIFQGYMKETRPRSNYFYFPKSCWYFRDKKMVR